MHRVAKLAFLPLVLLLILLTGHAPVRADEAPVIEVEVPLTGAEIYARYSERRTKQSYQKLRIISRDPGGSEQLSRFVLRVQDERDEDGNPTRGVRFKTRIDVSDPFDLRHTRYLIISKESGPNDEFVYQPSARRVRRINLSGNSFLGTDYTFGDFTVKNVEDAVHERLPDEEIDGEAVYVVESRIKDGIEAEYRRSIAYIEKQHFIPLRIRSWDDFDVEVKEMTAPVSMIRAFGDIWIASESTIRDIRQDTTSTLFVDELDAVSKFKRSTFTSGRLARGN